MNDLLHLGALALAAIGAGSLIGIRRGVGAPEIAAAVLMLAGMSDAMTVALLPPVVWFAVMVPTAIALAIRCRVPAALEGRRAQAGGMLSAHLALGLVSTAALILLMAAIPATGVAGAGASSAHSHGGGSGMPQVLSVALGLGAILLSAIALRAEPSWLHRVHHTTMAASTVAMAAIVAF
ncbi:hypothetical protein HWD99_02630 [Microbacterium sp. C5A9]|uniref:hypothetical protein n=1 Tax=Microbacterium sp. C5A9 TaxID=2736663 RepID=UPI001F519945|nr:hypothetical protein [Microbacterium sp. C5A9]MCI1017512.1 hypothetical protein [Microbacterium sp. C5A9]